MSGRLTDADQILEQLDNAAGRGPDAGKRHSSRRRWRTSLKIRVTHPGGDIRHVDVVTRNLSSGGLSFLNYGYLHSGSRCELQLITADNT